MVGEISIIHYNMKSHTGFRLVPKVLTLNDFGYFTQSGSAFGANYVKLTEARPVVP